MLRYTPGDSPAHRLDPRTKLFVQAAFVAAAFAHTTPRGLAVLTAVAVGLLAAARLRPWRVAYGYRYALPILLAAPLVAGATLGPPWLRIEATLATALASYRVLLVLVVSAFYVHTTPARESRAAIQRSVPGKPGQFLGLGVGFVFRFLPVLRDDLGRIRQASAARLGDRRPVHERMRQVAVGGLNRALSRADTFALALQARCLAWNPTLPDLRFSRADWWGVAAGGALAAFALV
ncbi:energy-coupling factor transporter transmembrane component T family protein [Halorarius halobius]|uniref:energy-coupling factor transporter transmembrane component T family protein n=1 Tax=Halorarius halobius TaxID=2962671 RepID=UPI0020CEE3D6|nr:energy-coupling factor transporter transmembrane protein EcfT [Halorarius halobius]